MPDTLTRLPQQRKGAFFQKAANENNAIAACTILVSIRFRDEFRTAGKSVCLWEHEWDIGRDGPSMNDNRFAADFLIRVKTALINGYSTKEFSQHSKIIVSVGITEKQTAYAPHEAHTEGVFLQFPVPDQCHKSALAHISNANDVLGVFTISTRGHLMNRIRNAAPGL